MQICVYNEVFRVSIDDVISQRRMDTRKAKLAAFCLAGQKNVEQIWLGTTPLQSQVSNWYSHYVLVAFSQRFHKLGHWTRSTKWFQPWKVHLYWTSEKFQSQMAWFQVLLSMLLHLRVRFMTRLRDNDCQKEVRVESEKVHSVFAHLGLCTIVHWYK